MATINPPTTGRPAPRVPGIEPLPMGPSRTDQGEQRLQPVVPLGFADYIPALVAILAGLAILAVHAPTAGSIVAIWIRAETFAHGFVVVPLCLWLAWRERDAVAAIEARPWWPGLVLVAGAGFVWLVTSLADVLGVQQFALAFMVQAAIVTVVGLKVARALVFPLIFLLFAVPAGEILVPTLIDRTADFTVGALRASGVPVYREANHFVIPSGSWSVVEACSGLRYIIASVMIGTIYAALTYRSAWRRVAFIGVSIVVPVVANWLRAYGIVMLGHLSNNRIAIGVDHLIYGWLFFGVVMVLLFWIGSLWREDDGPPIRRRDTPPADIVAAPMRSRRALIVAALAAVAVAGLWRPLEASLQRPVSTESPKLADLAGAGGWVLSGAQPTPWKPHYAGFAAEHTQIFAQGDREVGLYIAYYRNQRPGRELVMSANDLVRKDDWRWRLVARPRATVDWAGTAVEAPVAQISGLEHGLEALRIYWIGGRITASPYVAKALTAWTKLTGAGDDSALVVVYARSSRAMPARASLRDFAQAMSPAIDRMLTETREGSR